MSGHTEGPWATETDFFDDYVTRVVIPDMKGVHSTTIAHCMTNWRDAVAGERRISWKEAECNARLITTAPDGLSLAQSILADCTDTTPVEWIEMARGIVAKAEGV